MILNAAGKPFQDRDAATYKAQSLSEELGTPFEVVSHPDGLGYAVVRQLGMSAQATPAIVKTEIPSVPREDTVQDKPHTDTPLKLKELPEDSIFRTESFCPPKDMLDAKISTPKKDNPPPATNLPNQHPAPQELPPPMSRTPDPYPRRADVSSQAQYQQERQSARTPNDKWREKFPPLVSRPNLNAFWNYYCSMALAAVFYIAPFLGWGMFLTPHDVMSGNVFYRSMPAFIEFGALAVFLYFASVVAWVWLSNKYVVADRKVEHRRVFFFRKNSEIEIKDILSVDINQGLIGRILNYGDLLFATAGTAGQEVVFTNIKDPLEVKDAIYERKDAIAAFHEAYRQEFT